MCRWLAYSGSPVLMRSCCSSPGIRWSTRASTRGSARDHERRRVRDRLVRRRDTAGVFHSVEPAWNDRNLKDVGASSPARRSCSRTFARRPAAPIQQTNCHPFRHGTWLWMHNGLIREFATVKRDLALAVDPSLYPRDRGFDRLRDVLLPRAHARARGRRAGGGRACRRAHRGDRPPSRCRAADPDDGRHHRRRERVGVPLLERTQSRSLFYSTASRRCGPSTRTTRCSTSSSRRDAADRVGAARRPCRRLERGAGVELRRRPGRTGRAAAVHSTPNLRNPGPDVGATRSLVGCPATVDPK